MNEEIHCFTTKRKTAENEWKNDDPDFFQLYVMYIKNSDNSFFIPSR